MFIERDDPSIERNSLAVQLYFEMLSPGVALARLC